MCHHTWAQRSRRYEEECWIKDFTAEIISDVVNSFFITPQAWIKFSNQNLLSVFQLISSLKVVFPPFTFSIFSILNRLAKSSIQWYTRNFENNFTSSRTWWFSHSFSFSIISSKTFVKFLTTLDLIFLFKQTGHRVFPFRSFIFPLLNETLSN